MPLAEYVIALGDCYHAAGQPEAAQRQYALVAVLAQLQQANGVNMDLELTNPAPTLRPSGTQRARWRSTRKTRCFGSMPV
jgi:hypothetical protein